MTEVIRVFLDSSDYSALSDPSQKNPALVDMLQVLLDLRDLGRVHFFYSGTVLSEMAPIDPAYTSAAEQRTDMLVRLCGTNTLAWHSTILLNELASAYEMASPTSSVYSDIGDWYPLDVFRLLPNDQLDISKTITEVLRNSRLSRAERRKTQKQLLKHGQPRLNVRDMLFVEDSKNESIDKLLTQLPMRPEDALTLMRFYTGHATADEATSAFRSSLRDPRWMIQWFRQNHAELNEFVALLRNPANMANDAVLSAFEKAKEIRALDHTFGPDFADSIITNEKCIELQDSALSNIAAQLAETMLNIKFEPLSSEVLELRCPGLTVAIRSLYSAWWTATTKMPRTPKPNDFADAVHALYAPYVHIFRADSFMAPHIQRHAARYGVKVVPKLKGIGEAVDAVIASKS
jgi:hypothetical protein